MSVILRAAFIIFIAFGGVSVAHSADPLDIGENFNLIELNQYMRMGDNLPHFSIQNATADTLKLGLYHAPPDMFLHILGLADFEPTQLRLFSSDDKEFPPSPQSFDQVDFQIEAGRVQTYSLMGMTHMARPLWLWVPAQKRAFERRISYGRGFFLLIMAVGILASLILAFWRYGKLVYYIAAFSGFIFLTLLILSIPQFEAQDFMIVYNIELMRILLSGFFLMVIGLHGGVIFMQNMFKPFWVWFLGIFDVLLILFLGHLAFMLFYPFYGGPLMSEIGVGLLCIMALYSSGAVILAPRKK